VGVSSTSIRAFWPGTHASIPSGWTEDTAFTDRFLQGSDATFAGSANGGAATHGHTAASHTHTGNAHAHEFYSASAAGVSFFADVGGIKVSRRAHAHSTKTSAAATITYQSTTITVTAAAMQPPFVRMIVIAPNDAGQDIPDDAICFADAAAPTGFHITDGLGGTTDYDGKFVIGPATSGGDGGGTGGATTHTHSSPAHTHNDDDHVHAATICGTSSSELCLAGAISARGTTHHVVSFNSTGSGIDDVSSDAVTVDAVSSLPAYIDLVGIQNTSGAAATPDGVICPYVADISESGFPADWLLCDGTAGTLDCRNRQARITKTVGSAGGTGGNNTHTHTTQPHGHTHGAHTHGAQHSSYIGVGLVAAGAVNLVINTATDSHTHTWTMDNATPTMQNATVTMSTDDGRYLYRTVVWLKRLAVTAERVVHVGGPFLRTRVGYAG